MAWTDFRPGSTWVKAATNHWLTNVTTAQDDGTSLPVHLNMLTGELLVNGLPLDRLPHNYQIHPSYRTLFGQSTIEIMPSTVPGMAFAAKRSFCGHSIQFGMNKKDLLIQASKDGIRYEFIPAGVFRKHFPHAFHHDHVHWYNMEKGTVEFRRVEDAWNPSAAASWILIEEPRTCKWRLTRDNSSLILLSLPSESSQVLSEILSPLADPTFIHVVSQPLLKAAEVEIPGLQLRFGLNLGHNKLHCREFPGFFVNAVQSFGALTGLRNKLLLQNSDGDRVLLVLDGPVSYQLNKDKKHVRVAIQKSASGRVHMFNVDRRLGRLIDNGSLQSNLLLAYLHALTSFCLPDPLTQKTGTEQALSVLASAAVRSFDRLSDDDVRLLSNIATLTPSRAYYPANERVMQTVKWSSDLDFLAQHGAFKAAVQSIFDQARRTSIFYPESAVRLPDLHLHDLVHRDSIRTSAFRVSGFGAEDFTTEYDATHKARDQSQHSLRFSDAFKLSSLVYDGKQSLNLNVPSDVAGHLWSVLSSSTLNSSSKNGCKIEYSATLLAESPSKTVLPSWIGLIHSLSETNKFAAMMWLSTLSCSATDTLDMTTLQMLALSSTINSVAAIALPPSAASLSLSAGRAPSSAKLRSTVQGLLVGVVNSPMLSMLQNEFEDVHDFTKRRLLAYQEATDPIVDLIVKRLTGQWPCEDPFASDFSSDASLNADAYIDISKVMKLVKPMFKAWYDNFGFYQCLQRLESIISPLPVSPVVVPDLSMRSPCPKQISRARFVSRQDIFSADAPHTPGRRATCKFRIKSSTSPSDQNDRLDALIKRLRTVAAGSKYRERYVDDLQDSILDLQNSKSSLRLSSKLVQQDLDSHLQECRDNAESVFSTIMAAARPGSSKSPDLNLAAAAHATKQWPRISPTFFLQRLGRTMWPCLNQSWKDAIVQYGLALTDLQRAERLIKVFRSGSQMDLINELHNVGHVNWKPSEYPDSLLLEVESGLLIRENQERIASHMRTPEGARNAVMQLNMGEGKSSLIMPIVAAALADGTQLVRVVVAKPQSKQMAQMMISKLSGMLGRQIHYMPFNRALKLTEAAADAIVGLLRECMSNGGILLVQPEHILSFKLMGLESLILGERAVSRSLLRTQEFFETSSRDLVDECDENFSVKFELIYTMGKQKQVEMGPARWQCIREVLNLLRDASHETAQKFPGSLELTHCLPSRFPRIRVLRGDAQEDLFDAVARRICQTGLSGFSLARQSPEVREAVFNYITRLDLTTTDIGLVENGPFWNEYTQSTLLLLRGLFAAGILAFVFGQKRWRVNYGLDSSRNPSTRLAVPFRAKDQPSPRSEFSHPDVIIVLTTLSYYYGGLKPHELDAAFNHLVKSDQGDASYRAWVNDADGLPSSLSQLESINLGQLTLELFRSLSYGKATIDYFLANAVFPKEMREFPSKLSASGWDIGKTKTLPTTGFSGTNDSRTALPLPVHQLDLSEQKHTNALVIGYILQPSNACAILPAPESAQATASDADRLLGLVMNLEPPARVILDVGAQVLELDNLGVATRWMALADHSVQAVIFFDQHDELRVVNRKGRVESLQTSPFATQLDVCLVYLDESHTRGTDLRLPEHYRAAVTLGAGLTKDRLVQACMRMRKLGKGQTVVFCVPQEIRAKILERSSKSPDSRINVPDILEWTIWETWIDMRRSMPLWAVQGERFIRQDELWRKARNNGVASMTQAQAMRFLEDEAQSLEDRYRPLRGLRDELFKSDVGDYALIKERCVEFENLSFDSAALQEEQERELSPEMEQEKQVEKPAPAKRHLHKIDSDLVKFVCTGILPPQSRAWQPAFEALSNTSAAQLIDLSQLGKWGENDLLVTKDFASTAESSADGPSSFADLYQRPVQWILTAVRHGIVVTAIVISPCEAQSLLPRIKRSSKVVLHLYTARSKANFRSVDRLDFFTVPNHQPPPQVDRRIVTQLNLFSGQLYMNDYADFIDLSDFLGLATETAKDGCEVAPDGFILKDELGRLGGGSGLTQSPIKFLQKLMTIRKDGEEISEMTHMGKILGGVLLEDDEKTFAG